MVRLSEEWGHHACRYSGTLIDLRFPDLFNLS